jgi:hypothetical protein
MAKLNLAYFGPQTSSPWIGTKRISIMQGQVMFYTDIPSLAITETCKQLFQECISFFLEQNSVEVRCSPSINKATSRTLSYMEWNIGAGITSTSLRHLQTLHLALDISQYDATITQIDASCFYKLLSLKVLHFTFIYTKDARMLLVMPWSKLPIVKGLFLEIIENTPKEVEVRFGAWPALKDGVDSTDGKSKFMSIEEGYLEELAKRYGSLRGCRVPIKESLTSSSIN